MQLTEVLADKRSVLLERLIKLGGGKKYGQVVFLAGGAGSGKGFVTKNFMEGDKFKVRDVDEWKKTFLKISRLKNKYDEIRDLDLRNPKDVFKMHTFVRDKNVKNKTLDYLLSDLSEDRLPNIMFDVTLKEIDDITKVIPKLEAVGYDAKNIHIVWVLANYRIAVQRNSERDRVVPEDVFLQTHEGAARTMYDLVRGNLPRGVDGSIHVVLNNEENTVFYTDDKGKPIRTTKKGKTVIKDFTYLTLKRPGRKIMNEDKVMKQLLKWIKGNVPKTDLTKDIFS